MVLWELMSIKSLQPSSWFWISAHQTLNIIKQRRIVPTLKSNTLLYAYDDIGNFILLCFLLSTIKIVFYTQQSIFVVVSLFLWWWQFSQWEKPVGGTQLIWYRSRFSAMIHCWIIWFWFCSSKVMVGGSLELLHIQGSYSNSNTNSIQIELRMHLSPT